MFISSPIYNYYSVYGKKSLKGENRGGKGEEMAFNCEVFLIQLIIPMRSNYQHTVIYINTKITLALLFL